MSDFIYTSNRQPLSFLKDTLAKIQDEYTQEILEFHGTWGSVAVSKSHYAGLQPLETEEYICIIIGGPIFYFTKNSFSRDEISNAGTKAFLERWKTKKIDWMKDITGPYLILLINKLTHEVECITDLMMFIPLYKHENAGAICWGTHIDTVASTTKQSANIDEASLVDFVLHHAVTYPHTIYQEIFQGLPATIHRIGPVKDGLHLKPLSSETYWQPLEGDKFLDIREAAMVLREGTQEYISRLTESLTSAAQFISAGEDSRALSGLLPQDLKRDAYIFLDSMNREGKIANKVAASYELNFTPIFRSKTHYLDILPQASRLLGSGHQYFHAHALKFHQIANLANYPAVFGGYISDSLLKGKFAPIAPYAKRLPFLPQIPRAGESRTKKVHSRIFSEDVLHEITLRRTKHYQTVKKMRPESAHEWFELWPATMRYAMPNFHSSRRLFASYEIFMTNTSVEISAAVPITWKLNRRLFNHAFKPALQRTKYIFHADGRLPYFPWWVNLFVQMPTWSYQKAVKKMGLQRNVQGPWCDWTALMKSTTWDRLTTTWGNGSTSREISFAIKNGALHPNDKHLSLIGKVNLLQASYQTQNIVSTCHA